MVDFLPNIMPGIATGTATDIWARGQQQAYALLFVSLIERQNGYFMVYG